MDFTELSTTKNRKRFADLFNAFLGLAAIACLYFSSTMDDGWWRNILMNFGSGLISIPLVYLMAWPFLFREPSDIEISGRFLVHTSEVYDVAEKLVNSSERSIRSTSFQFRHSPSPDSYREKVFENLRKSKADDQISTRFELTLGYDFDTPIDEVEKVIEELDSDMKKYEISNLVDFYMKYSVQAMDVLLVDDKDIVFVLPEMRVDKQKIGIVLYNNPKLGWAISRWFDDFVIKDLQPYKFDREIHQQTGNRIYEAIHKTRWVGNIYQPEGPEGGPLDIDIEVDFKIHVGQVKGACSYEYKGFKTTIDLIGEAEKDALVFQYDDKDSKIKRYGVCVLELNGLGNVLTGRFVGYAPEMEGLDDSGRRVDGILVEGTMKITKSLKGEQQ